MNSHLTDLRLALLNLHKTLIESERINYEQVFGTVPTPNQLLALLTTDPWFDWLHPLSQLIVAMDTALDEKEPLTDAMVVALFDQSRQLLRPEEDATGFAGNYFDALQHDPAVVLAHADVTKVLGPLKRG